VGCKNCGKQIPVRAKGRGRRRTEWCNDECKAEYKLKALKAGRKVLQRRKPIRPDFDDERKKPEFQKGVAEILAWAEAQHPATPEARGIAVGREMKAACAMKTDNEAQALNA
jgi:hypothetical protein